MADPLHDMADVISLIEDTLKGLLDDEEKRLLDEKALLQLVYEEVTGTAFEDKTATELATTFTSAFVDQLIPNLTSVIETD